MYPYCLFLCSLDLYFWNLEYFSYKYFVLFGFVFLCLFVSVYFVNVCFVGIGFVLFRLTSFYSMSYNFCLSIVQFCYAFGYIFLTIFRNTITAQL
jgi:hypothetical protein